MPGQSQSTSLVEQAKFVFQGTVKQTKATTLKEVPVSNRTVVVRIDRVIQAPEVLSDYAGQDVTVQLAAGESVTVGQTLIFYTNGWIFGEGVAVQSIGHEAATTPAVAALSVHPDDPVRSLRAHEGMTQAAKADLIVTGRVSAVRLPAAEAQARATAMAVGRTDERISEHAPLWQEAVIDVDEVHKGSHSGKQVVVRFPSSTDVRWHRAPKFDTGQEGVFLLHKEQLAEGAVTAMAAGLGTDEYTSLDPADVQPLEELPRIQMAAQTAGANPSGRSRTGRAGTVDPDARK
jgi:hypothetical protein